MCYEMTQEMCYEICQGICREMCYEMCQGMCREMCYEMCQGMCWEMCYEMCQGMFFCHIPVLFQRVLLVYSDPNIVQFPNSIQIMQPLILQSIL